MSLRDMFGALPCFVRRAGGLALGALLLGSTAHAQSSLLWGSLRPGPYATGFRLQYQLDQSRDYDPDFVTDTTHLPAHHARPIMEAVWYPARRGQASPMTFGQYLDIASGSGAFAPFAQRLEHHQREVIAEETVGHAPGAMTPEEQQAFEHLLTTRTFAIKDASPAEGPFPVLIYHPGLGGSYEDNSVLFEYLASHGYIVVSSAYPDPDASTMSIVGDLGGTFSDLDFLVRFVRSLPHADPDRIGVMGHSYGAWASFAWTAREGAPVRALVTLDSGFEYDSLLGGPEVMQLHMKMNKDRIRAATLRFASQERHAQFQYLDPYLKFVPRYEASISSLTHNDYLTHGAIRPALMPEKWPDPTGDRRASYDQEVQIVWHFLDASLKQDSDAKASLQRIAGETAPDRRVILTFRPAPPRPPKGRQMARYLQQYGPEKAVAMLRAFPDVAAGQMVGGVISLLSDGDVKTALPTLVLASQVYPTSAALEVMLGQVLAQTNDRAGAERAYRKALALLPNDAQVGGLRPYWQREIERGLRGLGVPPAAEPDSASAR